MPVDQGMAMIPVATAEVNCHVMRAHTHTHTSKTPFFCSSVCGCPDPNDSMSDGVTSQLEPWNALFYPFQPKIRDDEFHTVFLAS